MRILIHSLYFFPDRTGVGKYTGATARWLADRGHSVDVLTGFPHYPEWRLAPTYKRVGFVEENWEGVRIVRVPHYVPAGAHPSAGRRMLIDLSFGLATLPFWIGRFFSAKKYDVVITVCPPLVSSLMPCFYQALRRVPYIAIVQDFQVDAAVRLDLLKSRLVARILFRAENFLLGSARAVASISGAMCRRLLEKGVDPSRVLRLDNWADLDSVVPGPRLNAFRSELGIADDKLIVMYAGAMGAKQGLDLVVDGAEKLRGDARLHFVFVGDGSDRARLVARCENLQLLNVSFAPVQSARRFPDVLAAADVHLVVQKAEAADLVMPSKLTNIFASGRTCIVTAAADTELSQVVTQSGAGIVVTPGHLDAFCSAMEYLADHPDVRREMGVKARAYAKTNLDQDVILGQFENALTTLAGRRSERQQLELQKRKGGL